MCRDKYAFVGLGRTATHPLVSREPFFLVFFSTAHEWLVHFQRSAPCAENNCHFEDFLHTLSLLLLSLYLVWSGLHIRSILCIVFIGLGFYTWVSDTTFNSAELRSKFLFSSFFFFFFLGDGLGFEWDLDLHIWKHLAI